MNVVRKFTCALTGDKMVVVENAFGDHICISEQEATDIQTRAEYDRRQLEMEIG